MFSPLLFVVAIPSVEILETQRVFKPPRRLALLNLRNLRRLGDPKAGV
jgi:hypothetical protein